MLEISAQIAILCLVFTFRPESAFLLTPGPTCYQCDAVFSPESCTSTHQCSQDQNCYTERLRAPDGTTVYRLGCIPTHTCSSLGGGSLCFGCCPNYLCNRHQCKEEICPHLYYGSGCAYRCGNCANGERCEKTTGHCLHGCQAGYVAPYCQAACPSPWYGQGCSSRCGRCVNRERCDYRTGMCTNGCESGFMAPLFTQASVIRLVNGPSSREGRLEVFHQNIWGTVCDDGFTSKAVQVACRQLGLPSDGAAPVVIAKYGTGTGKIWLDDVGCRGDEPTLDDCPHLGWGSHNCGHNEDVGIHCTNIIRLVGGSSPTEGRVEVQHGGGWGTVCDDSFDNMGARVVCRTLGFHGTAIAKPNAFFGQGTGTIWLDEVRCTGNEDHISYCPHTGWGLHNCGHGEDVGVVCSY